MQRCNECGTIDLGKECAERTGECLWVCGECGSIWRDGEDLTGPASGETNSYVPPPGGAQLAEFVPVPASPHDRSAYPKAVRAVGDLVYMGSYGGIMLGTSVTEAPSLLALGSGDGQWTPEEGPFRVRISADRVAEIEIRPPGGPLPMPGDLPPGPDLSLINVSLAEEAVADAHGSSERTGEFMGKVRVDFRTPDTVGDLHFVRYRLVRARVRPAD
ncbi:hypothetical protein [Nocardiopsis baichengensis]|uniref:hypothetical protein n=1 Tax=Nocardiopsis baichengensis TaxID=280240 RepID=UPI00034CE177|nr:hypothetical protein [Nocardiopsis baichengensis]